MVSLIRTEYIDKRICIKCGKTLKFEGNTKVTVKKK